MNILAPLLVLGVQRSGTTLLGNLLSQHPELNLTVNGKIIYYCLVWLKQMPQDTALTAHPRLDEICYALQRKPILGAGNGKLSQIQQAIHTYASQSELFENLSVNEAIHAICREVYITLNERAQVWGDKYNEYLLHLEAINEIFPNAKYIFIWRDPYDVADSMVQSFQGRPWAPCEHTAALVKWSQWNQKWLDFRTRISKSRYFEIRYEDLATNPRVHLTKICAFLDINPCSKLLDLAEQTVTTEPIGRSKYLISTLRQQTENLESMLQPVISQLSELLV
jgi:hypothetical protein